MRPRAAFAASLAAAALLAASAPVFAQDPGAGPGAPKGSGAAPPAEKPAAAPKEVLDTQVEIRGSRYRVKLNHGAEIEGILAQGVHWEKLDPMSGEYEDCAETDKGAGLRLSFVLNVDGDIFVMKRDIKEMRDLGALTDAQKRAIRDQVIADRKQKILDREKALKEEMDKMKGRREDGKKGDGAAGKGKTGESEGAGEGEGAKKGAASEAEDMEKGDALLEKFPPEEWSEERRKEILKRRYTVGTFPNETEKEFIDNDNFKLWKAALERRQAAEEKKSGGGKKEGEKQEGGKKETPPAGGGY